MSVNVIQNGRLIQVAGGGGGGDYNNLINTPIHNLVGLTSPIDLSELSPGVYNISGNVKYSETEPSQLWKNSKLLTVESDSTLPNAKLVTFNISEEGSLFTIVIKYAEDGSKTVKKISYDSIGGFTTVSELPQEEEGDIHTIYMAPDGMYIYTGTDYQKLGDGSADPAWETL